MNKKSIFSLIVFAVSGFILLGCQTTPIQQVGLRQTHEIPTGANAKPIQFKKIVVKLSRGTRIGQYQVGLLCAPGPDIVWQGGRAVLTGDEFTDAFRSELQKANYPIVGNPDALFEDASDWKAELLIAGLVNQLQANICLPNAGFGNYMLAKGEAYINVKWQIYSRLDRKIVYETVTEGSARRGSTTTDGGTGIFVDAFAAATQNLLGDDGFYNLIIKKSQINEALEYPKITIGSAKLFARALDNQITDVRAGVVTVFAGDGHGSGFFISPKGYVLTNAHVVGGAKFVKVKLTTGRELLGEVVRSNGRRDVALIKIEEENMKPLPIRTSEVNVGGEVYALGSPLDQKYSTTVSKGIISGYRTEDEIRLIQSDVNILPGNSGGPLVDNKGNVVGMSVSGIVFRGAPSGLNFFIPINSALKELNIVLN